MSYGVHKNDVLDARTDRRTVGITTSLSAYVGQGQELDTYHM